MDLAFNLQGSNQGACSQPVRGLGLFSRLKEVLMVVRVSERAEGVKQASFGRAFRQAPWRKHRQILAPLAMAVFAAALFGTVYLAETSRAAVTGRNVQRLRRQVEKLGFENDLLRAHNATVQSAAALMERAEQFGYHPLQIEQIEFMEVAGFSHDSRSTAQTQLAEQESQSIYPYDETLAHWVMRQLPKWGLLEE
jgi:hypothetical protein